MRPLLIILLLLRTLLAAVDANPKCDRSLIKGVDPLKIDFDDATKTLTCVTGKNSLMAIELNSMRYASLKCDDVDGWKAKKPKDREMEEYKVADASIPLNITCVEYCAVTGVGINVAKSDYTAKNDIIEIDCPHSYKYMGETYKEQLYSDDIKLDRAYCGLSINQPFEWMLYLDEGSLNLISRKDSGIPTKFECRLDPPSIPTTIPIVNNEPSDTTYVILQSTTRTPVKPDFGLKCNLSLIKGVESSEIQVDDATNTLTCISKENSLKGIKVRYPKDPEESSYPEKIREGYFVAFTCDIHNFWVARRHDASTFDPHTVQFQDASAPINIDCFEYCAATGVGIKVAKEIKHGIYFVRISCANADQEKLFYEQSHILEAECSLNHGWRWKYEHKDNEFSFFRSEMSPEQFECKKDSRLKCDRSLFKGVDLSEIHFDEATKRLTCVGGENRRRAIKFHYDRYSTLTCDESEGWKAYKKFDDGTWGFYTIAAASATLEISCVEYCHATGVGIKVEKANNFEYDGDIKISCAEKFVYLGEEYWEQLFYGLKHVSGAFCNLGYYDQWRLYLDEKDVNPVFRYGFRRDPAKFECRLALPTPIATTTERTTVTTTLKKNVEPTTAIPITTTTTQPSITRRPEEKVSIAEAQSGDQMPLIIVGCLVGGFILGVIVVSATFKLLLAKKKRPESSSSVKSVKAAEEGSKSKKKSTGSDKVKSDVDNVSSGR